MKTYLDCIPCFIRQGLFAARKAGLSQQEQKEVIDEIAGIIPEISLLMPPPEIALKVYGIVEKKCLSDPFFKEKKMSNDIVMKHYHQLEDMIFKSDNPLLTGLKIAAMGNIIDLGASNFDIEKFDLPGEIGKGIKEDFVISDFVSFRENLSVAKKILYIGDNAGEIVFDKAFISYLRTLGKEILFAVRGKPIINDVTVEDALYVKMNETAEIIDSGVPTPGCMIKYSSEAFKEVLDNSDLILSKGQGNYESLNSEKLGIYFLFKVKCYIVADNLNIPTGSMVLKKE